jgi:hypothetical protein
MSCWQYVHCHFALDANPHDSSNRQVPSECEVVVQFCLDYYLILKALPDPIRGLLRVRWLGSCGADGVIADTSIPCAENMVLVGARPCRDVASLALYTQRVHQCSTRHSTKLGVNIWQK